MNTFPNPLPSPIRAVIWDFNGTLIDDVELSVCAINTMLARRGLRHLDTEGYRQVFGFPLAAYYQKIGIDVRPGDLSSLADEFHASYLAGLHTCLPTKGVLEVLQLLQASGVKQVILSAMEEESLRSAIAGLGLGGFFDQVYGLEHRRADSKLERGRQLLQTLSLPPTEMLLIGDTDHDVEVARALGIRPFVVAQGHQSAHRLSAAGFDVFPDFERLCQALAGVLPH